MKKKINNDNILLVISLIIALFLFLYLENKYVYEPNIRQQEIEGNQTCLKHNLTFNSQLNFNIINCINKEGIIIQVAQ